MKKLLLLTFLIVVCNCAINAQDNSVELRDAANGLVSSHNSLQAAYTAIPSPMTQAYNVVILGTYAGANEVFPITLTARDSSSSERRITIYPAAGVSMVTVGGSASNLEIILLDGADYVTINGSAGNGAPGSGINLTVQNLVTTGSNSEALKLFNGATHNQFVNCKFLSNTQGTAGPRTVEFETATANPEGNSDNSLTYCEIVGGRSGVGIAGTAANPNRNIVIRNNKIYDFSFAGVWVLSGVNSFDISNNEIYETQGYNTANSGLNISIILGTNTVSYNTIYNLQNTSTSTLRGISVSSSSNGGTLRIFNNMISLPLDNGTKTSIYAIQTAGSGDYNAEIIYNTIFIAGAHTGGTSGVIISGGIVKSNTGDTSAYSVKNNLIINRRTGGNAGTIHTGAFYGTSSLVGALDINYNSYYGIDSTSFHAGWGGSVYSSLAQYRDSAAPHEQNSIFRNAEFVALTDLHLTGASNGDLNLAGTPIAGITDDFDGDNRNASKPYMGADEAVIPLPVELASFSANVAGKDVELTWTTVTELNSKSFVIERMPVNGLWSVTGEITAAGSSSEIKTYSFTDKNVPAGSYSYRLKTVDFDGSYKFSPVVEVSLGVPEVFAVSQNFPNPFNPATTIEFQLPTDAYVTMELYAVTGEKVATLINSEIGAGFHRQIIDASSLRLTSGVYIYRFTARDNNAKEFRDIRKMTLLK